MGIIETIISIIILLIFVGVVWWAAQKLIALIPMNETIKEVIYILLVLLLVIIVIWVLLSILSAVGIHISNFGKL